MYLLGIDPGSRKLGYAVVDSKLQILDSGILLSEIKSPSRQDYFIRFVEIYDFFEDLIKKYKISAVAMEKLFFTKYNQSNAEFVYGVRAILITLFCKHNIKIYEYTPKELKKYITGNGLASKDFVKAFIKKLYGLKNLPEYDDAADALGLAFVCSKILKNN